MKEDIIATIEKLSVENVESIDEELIAARLAAIDRASRRVREEIGIVSFRHSPVGDRRSYSRDRRHHITAAPPEPPVETLDANNERRYGAERRRPLDERCRELEADLNRLVEENQRLFRLRHSMLLRPDPSKRRPQKQN